MLDDITLCWLTNTAASAAPQYWENRAERGGHFAAWEEPQLFSSAVRAAFRSLR